MAQIQVSPQSKYLNFLSSMVSLFLLFGCVLRFINHSGSLASPRFQKLTNICSILWENDEFNPQVLSKGREYSSHLLEMWLLTIPAAELFHFSILFIPLPGLYLYFADRPHSKTEKRERVKINNQKEAPTLLVFSGLYHRNSRWGISSITNTFHLRLACDVLWGFLHN